MLFPLVATSVARLTRGGSHVIAKREFRKSAHTALAVKACLFGGNSNTTCSMTFVNIAVAISALAGGAKNGFAPRPEYGGVFDIFRGFLGV